jgi:predicted nucleic acid-binding protein
MVAPIARVYVDTSVIGGCLDEEFGRHSQRLADDFAAGRMRAVVSDVTLAELRTAPPEVRRLLDLPGFAQAEMVHLTDEAIGLADAYIREGATQASSRVDALHIAVATVYRVDVVASWNFRHIVKLSRIRAYNAVNLKLGYPELEIRSPLEVYYEET